MNGEPTGKVSTLMHSPHFNWIVTLVLPVVSCAVFWGAAQQRIGTLETDLAAEKTFHKMSREEVTDYVDKHSPYAEAREAINTTMRQLADVQQRQAMQIEDVRKEVNAGQRDAARMDAKLDMILTEVRTRPAGDKKP